MKKTARIVSLILVLCMLTGVFTIVAACHDKETDGYTYRLYSGSLGNNWNPHSWQTNADDSILEQTTIGLLDAIYDGEGIYKWQPEMASELPKDITSSLSAELKTRYEIGDSEAGRAWQIKLNKNAKWETGEAINADDYIWSMQMCLNPELSNYRANSYYSNDTAIYGAKDYYNQGKTIWKDAYNTLWDHDELWTDVEDLTKGSDGTYSFNGHALAITLNDGLEWLSGDSLSFYVEYDADYNQGWFDHDAWEPLKALADREGYVPVTDASMELLAQLISTDDWGEDESNVICYMVIESGTYGSYNWEDVGLYKVDDYTIVYVTAEPVSEFNFYIACQGASWLVHKKTYQDSIVTKGGIKTSQYGTSMKTYKSYGPYKLSVYQADKQVVYVQNEQWYGWEKERGEFGELVSYHTLADGSRVRQFQTTKIIVDVMTPDAAKQAFLKGDLDDYGLQSADMATYRTSDRLYQVDATYTTRFFFNTSAAEKLDAANTNQNSVVLTNVNFRKAFSLAINRSELTSTATPGYKPAFALLNTLYYFDVENDPSSVYRTSEWGMKAVVEGMYNIPYGAGQTYATLEEAYAAVTGYDLDQAKALMKTAHDELVAAGKYVSGQPIKIQVAYSYAKELSADAQASNTLVNKYLNAAAQGSGFGEITLEYLAGMTDVYGDVPQGKYAIGYGAWGGAAFYPFKMMECYMEPDEMAAAGGINEAGCFNPKTEEMTVSSFQYKDSNGQMQTFAEETMTWENWSKAIKTTGTGKYVTADVNLKLALLSKIESAFLQQYYCIPIASQTEVGLDGYKIKNITENYNIMYGFGGLRFMSYNYSDFAWAKWVKENSRNGVLAY